MNAPLKISTMQRIAKSKGLRFAWNDNSKSYMMYDAKTGDMLMEYANITIALMTSDVKWRQECNKLKSNNG